MNTSNPTASRTRLGGTPTNASQSLALNTGYLSQTTPFVAQGIDTLTEHVLVNIGTAVDNNGWANMIDAMYRTLQVNSNRVPSYSAAQLSAYVSMATNMQIALAELRRDMALGSMIDSYSISLLRDLFGEKYDDLYTSYVSNRARNISDFNYTLENLRNVYPVPATSYTNMARYILGSIFRDDSTRRGQYILFHTGTALDPVNITTTVPYMKTFDERINFLNTWIKVYLSMTTDGIVNAKVAAQIAADITRVYGSYAYWQMAPATDADILVPICDAPLMHAMNFDVNGVWDPSALKAAFTGTALAVNLSTSTLNADTYPRFANYAAVFGSADDLALTKTATIDHVVITDRSEEPAADSLADIMAFTSIPQIVNASRFSASSGQTSSQKHGVAASPSGITPACVWFNTTTSSRTTGALTVTSHVAKIQNFLSESATSLNLTDLENVIPAMWTNGFTPSVMQVASDGSVTRRLILAEVDEVTNIEYQSLVNMLIALSQRYDDMFTMFLTKEVKPKVSLKTGAAAVDVKSANT